MSARAQLQRLSLQQLVASTGRAPAAADFTPTRVVVVDVERPLPSFEIDSTHPGGHQAVWMLVRLHARPLGALTLTAADLPMSSAGVDVLVQQRWGATIEQHLRIHGASVGAEVGGDSPAPPWNSCVLLPSAQPSVSVVVPTFRRPADVVRCVESILATGYPNLEILVVDNAPSDVSTASAVTERFAGDARVRYLSEAIPGASRARNRGVAHAGGDIVAFADDDVVVDRYWIAALVNGLELHPDVDCVTGLVLPQSMDTPVEMLFEHFGGFNRGYVQRKFDLAQRRGDTLLYPYTAGALGASNNAAFRRSALSRPDAFDVRLGPGTPAFGAEDQDAFVSLLRRGKRLLYEPAALVHHRHRGDYSALRWQIFTYGAGLSAALVHWALKERAVAVELTRRVLADLPQVMRGGYRAQSLQSASEAFPSNLRTLERLGYLYGPVAYARAVVRDRRLQRSMSRSTARKHQ